MPARRTARCSTRSSIDPRDARHMYVATSTGGVFETPRRGATWKPLNQGVEANFLPDPYPEYGQDAHYWRCPDRPDRLYQQNHCGIYRIDRPADAWERIGDDMPADDRRHRLPDRRCIRATRTPPGSSRWTAPTCGRARARAAGRPSTARATPAASWAAPGQRLPGGAGLVHRQAPGLARRRRRSGRALPRHHRAASSGRASTRAKRWTLDRPAPAEIYSVEAGPTG